MREKCTTRMPPRSCAVEAAQTGDQRAPLPILTCYGVHSPPHGVFRQALRPWSLRFSLKIRPCTRSDIWAPAIGKKHLVSRVTSEEASLCVSSLIEQAVYG
jgi:hypothetical protein